MIVLPESSKVDGIKKLIIAAFQITVGFSQRA
jgi:hypothetical protein